LRLLSQRMRVHRDGDPGYGQHAKWALHITSA
jgi:hypothetical protein